MNYSFLDEKKMVQDLLKDKSSINKNTIQKLIGYIKYLKQEEKSKDEVRIEIEDLMDKYYMGFCVADWDSLFNSLIDKAFNPKSNSTLKSNENINITRKELEYIKQFKNENIEKLLFTMLVIGKYSKGSDQIGIWINCDSTEMFKLAKFKYGKSTEKGSRFEQREYLIYDLANMENPPIQISHKCNSTSIKVLFNDIEHDEEGLNIIINQDNVQQLPYYYIEWKTPEKIVRCQECGCLVEVKSKKSKPKYCVKCAKIISNKQKNESKKRKSEKR